MLLVAGRGNSGVGEARGYIWGDILVLLAQFSYAFYIVCYKDLVGKYSPITIMKWMFTYSFLFTAPFSYGQFTSYNYIQPLVASVVAVCWGMDSFGISKAAAAALIFGGVYMVTTGSSKKSSAK